MQHGTAIAPDKAALDACWDVAARIMASLAPKGHELEGYRVAVQRLKYQSSPSELDMLASLTSDSLARWGRLGFRIDRNRGMLRRGLSGKWVSDALGLLMAAPLGRAIAGWAGRHGTAEPDGGAGDMSAIIEREHTDRRYFSALCGERQNVDTEVLFQGSWCRLPVSLGKLAIFPGELAKRDFGLNPVLHRVVYAPQRSSDKVEVKSGDVTLLLGAN